jgi:hypothetical protein
MFAKLFGHLIFLNWGHSRLVGRTHHPAANRPAQNKCRRPIDSQKAQPRLIRPPSAKIQEKEVVPWVWTHDLQQLCIMPYQ